MATRTKVKLTLRIDNSANKVIFAEAKKDFVDILFNILSLPIGSVIKLLENEDKFGSIDNLYKSLENMDKYHLQPNHNKDQLLNPGVTASVLCDPLMLLPSGSQPKQRTLYKCEKDRHVTDSKYASCPNCYAEMNYQLWYVEFQNAKNVLGGGGEVVMPLTTYMVTDDLHIKPFSMISSVDLLQNNVKNAEDIGDLEERFVEFGPDEALELLRTSLKSKATLTNVFLMKKKEVYEGEGRLRMAEEDRMEALK
ncbi:hypothetical protein LWI29_035053 [Acer saccharum]|uniref:Uncharacterized protein n=1 Tax=Acer saccharum TaxID=4024 RepID=A0AA39SK74_ACESA|nr:hypothetical protein LWI29_035053 [Acer saccharum]